MPRLQGLRTFSHQDHVIYFLPDPGADAFRDDHDKFLVGFYEMRVCCLYKMKSGLPISSRRGADASCQEKGGSRVVGMNVR